MSKKQLSLISKALSNTFKPEQVLKVLSTNGVKINAALRDVRSNESAMKVAYSFLPKWSKRANDMHKTKEASVRKVELFKEIAETIRLGTSEQARVTMVRAKKLLASCNVTFENVPVISFQIAKLNQERVKELALLAGLEISDSERTKLKATISEYYEQKLIQMGSVLLIEDALVDAKVIDTISEEIPAEV